MSANRSASVLARLLNLAKERGDDYNLLLTRFALERLLYRISTSTHADRFLLKGAMLFALWYDTPHRPTKDVDLLGFGADDAEHLGNVFQSIAEMNLDDGVAFDPQSVRVSQIREDDHYGGTRINLLARIGSARCALQIDVGFGDAVTPGPETVKFPTLLKEFEAPTLRVYPVYTVIAEKYQAMVMLGLANSRMKDFYDLSIIAQRTALDGKTLAGAIAATFARRGTELPAERSLALTLEFGENPDKVRQWQAFVRKNGVAAALSLAETVSLLEALLWLPTQFLGTRRDVEMEWSPSKAAWNLR